MIKRLTLAAAIAASALSAQAEIQFTAGLDLQSGGEELGKIEFNNGTSETVSTGSGIALSGGFLYVQDQFDVGARIKYLFDSTSGKTENGRTEIEMEFSRIPLDFVAHYRIQKHHFGGGITYHMNPEFTADRKSSEVGDAKLTTEFDDAIGATLEYKYQYSKRGSFLVKYTSIEYKVSSNGTTFDGSGFGVGAELNF